MPGEHSLPPPAAYAIVPAAGASRRMGSPKLLLPWRGKTLIEHVLTAWKQSAVRATFVVIRPRDEELANVVQSVGALVVRPPLPPPDMRASVSFGLGEIGRLFAPKKEDAWLVAPADLPRLSSAVIDRLIAEHANDPAAALVPMVHGRRGHPVLFPWSWKDRVKHLDADQGLNVLLDQGVTRRIDCSDLTNLEAFADIDKPEDFEAL